MIPIGTRADRSCRVARTSDCRRAVLCTFCAHQKRHLRDFGSCGILPLDDRWTRNPLSSAALCATYWFARRRVKNGVWESLPLRFSPRFVWPLATPDRCSSSARCRRIFCAQMCTKVEPTQPSSRFSRSDYSLPQAAGINGMAVHPIGPQALAWRKVLFPTLRHAATSIMTSVIAENVPLSDKAVFASSRVRPVVSQGSVAVSYRVSEVSAATRGQPQREVHYLRL
jgi:hypothetical protein